MSVSESTRLSRIIEGHGPVLGASIDGLAREIEGRIRPEERADFVTLIETWPLDAGGDPVDGGGLYATLLAMRKRPARLPPSQAEGSPGAAIRGLLVGAAVGLPLGFVLYMALRALVIPTSLWSSDAVQWGVTLAVMAVFGGTGFWQGRWPSRGGAALWAGFTGGLWGVVLGGVCGGALALLLGAMFGASQREGAFAMGVVFGVIPLAGVLGGLAMAARQGRRAWRGWGA